MSRVGKRIINIPTNTSVSVSSGNLIVKGPLGELQRKVLPSISIIIDDNQITLKPEKSDLETNALWGTYSAHLSNMIKGVNTAFEKKMIIEGVGFKAEATGETLNLNLGFSHPVKVSVPKDLKVTTEKNTITVSGIDKESVGRFSAKIRAMKKPEPYKGKGIRYDGEVIKRKEGKKSS